MSEVGDKEDKPEFTSEGETLGYISLDQAQILAMRTAREAPGAYGRRFARVPMAFEVIEATETEDYYEVTLSFRPEGEFTGTPGREQLFIEKEGNLAVRQVLSLPGRVGWRRIPVGLVAIGLVAVVAAAVGGIFAATSGGGGNDDSARQSAAALPAGTSVPPISTLVPIPTTAPAIAPPLVATATTNAPVSTATTMPTLIPTLTALPTATSTPRPTPIPTTAANVEDLLRTARIDGLDSEWTDSLPFAIMILGIVPAVLGPILRPFITLRHPTNCL